MSAKVVRIGSCSAMWGDSPGAARQLVMGGNIDYLVGDYLAELTMAIMASKKMKNPDTGFATDWVYATMKPLLKQIKQKGIKVITNAGGLNPNACKDALLKAAAKAGVELKVAVVYGDDLKERVMEFYEGKVTDIWSKDPFPNPMMVLSSNCYLGARPIAEALARGAEVVITGRVVDSALVLAPLMFEHGWTDTDYDQLSAGSLAGHIIECGCQGTGGLYTDWTHAAADWDKMGYPIVEVSRDGSFVVSKVDGTGGHIVPRAVGEQLLYEIGDPGAYHLPDVACDWTAVQMTQLATDRVRVSGAKGLPPTSTLKVCTTFAHGYKLSVSFCIGGQNAAAKGRATAHALLKRAGRILEAKELGPLEEHLVEVFGAETIFGPHASAAAEQAREVVVRMSARHSNKKALKILTKEVASAFVSMSPGTFGIVGGRMAPMPVIAQFSSLVSKSDITQTVSSNFGDDFKVPMASQGGFQQSGSASVVGVTTADAQADGPTVRVPLIELASGRSGDKGSSVNIGIIARAPEYLPYLRAQLTEESVQQHFAYKSRGRTRRFDLPGLNAMNFLLDDALGGGGMYTLQADALGKAYAQILLTSFYIDIPTRLLPAPTARL